MDTQDALVAIVPAVTTAALGYAAATMKARAERDEKQAAIRSEVEVAKIGAESNTEDHLWEYLHDANARHEKDIERLHEALDRCRQLEAELIVSRGKLEIKRLESEIGE